MLFFELSWNQRFAHTTQKPHDTWIQMPRRYIFFNLLITNELPSPRRVVTLLNLRDLLVSGAFISHFIIPC